MDLEYHSITAHHPFFHGSLTRMTSRDAFLDEMVIMKYAFINFHYKSYALELVPTYFFP